MHGLDLSYHNGTVDFNTIKNNGNDFVILRCGYGVNGTKDPKFEEYYRLAKSAGLKVGAYYYSYALNVTGAKAEANNCLSYIIGKQFEMPVYIDMEDADRYKSKNGMPLNSTLNDICNEFCRILESNGYYAGVYASKSWFDTKLTSIGNYTKWIARYGTNDGTKQFDYPSYGMYQFTSAYKINGKVFDRNYCYVDFTSAILKNGLNGYPLNPDLTGEGATTGTASTGSAEVESVATWWKGNINYYLENDRVGVWQRAMNRGFDTDELSIDNKFGIASQNFAKTHILWTGQRHNCPTAIRWLQTILRDHYEFYNLDIDGIFGSYTEKCVEEFQYNRNITADGKVGLVTTYYLLEGTVY